MQRNWLLGAALAAIFASATGGAALDASSAAFPLSNLSFGPHDVIINLAGTPEFSTTGTVVIDLAATSASAVPEPTPWAMIIAGAGLLGGVFRSRRSVLSPASPAKWRCA